MRKANRQHHAIPSPSGGQDGGTGEAGKRAGRQSIRQAGRRTASHHPPASEEQDDEEDDGTGKQQATQGEPCGSSERAEARERYGNEARRQTAAMPAAANQIDARTSHAPGAGDYSKQAD